MNVSNAASSLVVTFRVVIRLLVYINFMMYLLLAAKCEALENPNNGIVTFTTLYEGSVATYTCDNTFKLNGQSTRTCQSGGQWSGDDPSCTRKFDQLSRDSIIQHEMKVMWSIFIFVCSVANPSNQDSRMKTPQ